MPAMIASDAGQRQQGATGETDRVRHGRVQWLIAQAQKLSGLGTQENDGNEADQQEFGIGLEQFAERRARKTGAAGRQRD